MCARRPHCCRVSSACGQVCTLVHGVCGHPIYSLIWGISHLGLYPNLHMFVLADFPDDALSKFCQAANDHMCANILAGHGAHLTMCSATAAALVHVWKQLHNVQGTDTTTSFSNTDDVEAMSNCVGQLTNDALIYVDLRPPSQAEGHTLCIWIRWDLQSFQVKGRGRPLSCV